MKSNCHLILVLLVSFFTSYSQSYQVIYEEYINIDPSSIEKASQNQEKEAIEAMFTQKKQLTYKDGLSSYANIPEKGINGSSELSQLAESAYYKDHKKKEAIEYLPNYLPMLYAEDISVVNPITIHNWKITKQQKNIAGYNCLLAQYTQPDGFKISAWFTDELAINEGPRNFWGLPGLILQLQMNENILLVARSIKNDVEDDITIAIPKNKNVMNQKEFDSLQKELSKPKTVVQPDGTVLRFLDPSTVK